MGVEISTRHATGPRPDPAQIAEAWKQAISYGTLPETSLDPLTMFDDVFKERTPHLDRQREQFIKLKG